MFQQFRTVIASVSGTGFITTVSQTGSPDSHQFPPAHYLKVVALNEDGKELDSYTLPAQSRLHFSVIGDYFDTVKMQAGSIEATSEGDIRNVHTNAGDIIIKCCHNLDTVQTNAGDIRVEKARKVKGFVKSNAGTIRIQETVKRGRSKSPKRKATK